MKKILVLLFALLLAAPLFSQVQFGLKAGVSTDFTFTNLDLSQANVDVVLENAKSAEWGFQGGAFLRASFAGLYIQPELLLATATNTLTYSGVVDGAPVDEILEQKFTKVNIPLLVGFKLAFFRINAGPAASFLINLSLIHISEPTRLGMISYAVFCLKKKKKKIKKTKTTIYSQSN